MKRVVTAVGVACCAGAVVFALSAVAGPVLPLDPDTNSWIKVSAMGQLHYSYTDSAADQEDFFLRRGSILLDGQVMDGVKFSIFTDTPNEGKNGASASTIIQEAWMDVQMLEDHWVRGGLIRLPFSFEARSSSASALGVDANGEVIKLVNTLNVRDNGAELHGRFCKYFSYIAGAFDGYDASGSTKNLGAPLRATGHLAVNVVGEAEYSPNYTQERLSDKPYVSFGVGGDMQDKASLIPASTNAVTLAITPAEVRDSQNWVVDVESGFKAGPVNVTINGGYYVWDNSQFEGKTAFVEDGIRYNKTQLVTKYTLQDPDSGSTTEDYTVGINYFLKGHNARVGVEYRWGDSQDQVLGGLQFLL